MTLDTIYLVESIMALTSDMSIQFVRLHATSTLDSKFWDSYYCPHSNIWENSQKNSGICCAYNYSFMIANRFKSELTEGRHLDRSGWVLSQMRQDMPCSNVLICNSMLSTSSQWSSPKLQCPSFYCGYDWLNQHHEIQLILSHPLSRSWVTDSKFNYEDDISGMASPIFGHLISVNCLGVHHEPISILHQCLLEQ